MTRPTMILGAAGVDINDLIDSAEPISLGEQVGVDEARAEMSALCAELATVRARVRAATIYLEGVGEDFPELRVAVTNALYLLTD